jgi:hypothetical protein
MFIKKGNSASSGTVLRNYKHIPLRCLPQCRYLLDAQQLFGNHEKSIQLAEAEYLNDGPSTASTWQYAQNCASNKTVQQLKFEVDLPSNASSRRVAS